MVRKHISRDWSKHLKEVITDEELAQHITFECFAYDPQYTQIFSRQHKNITKFSNASNASWNSATCYRSTDLQNDMVFNIKFNSEVVGEYRVDILYEQSNFICQTYDKNKKKYDTSKDLVGSIKITPTPITDTSSSVKVETSVLDGIDYSTISEPLSKELSEKQTFDGENNYLKRITKYYTLPIGSNELEIKVPHNCYFYGVIVRKLKRYWGDNLDSAGSNLEFTDADLSISKMGETTELSVTVGYDDAFECETSPSGFYMDYYNECNLILKDDSKKEEIVFGGYLSSILPNDDRTTLSIHCADRLLDGQNRFLLDELVMQKGESALSDNEYVPAMEKSFDTYPHLLKYLCDCYEVTLKSNISGNYLVEGEKYSKGFTINFSKKKAPKKMTVTNGTLTQNKKSILVRNDKNGKKKQVWTLYEAKENSKKPVEITSYPYMHITYGLGKAKKSDSTKTTETVDVANAGSQKFTKCGRSADGKYLMAIGQRSVGRGSKTYPYNNIYKAIFKNKCPHCGGKLVWDRGNSKADCVHCGPYRHSKREWGNISETEITCSSCCADFCSVTGYDKDGRYSKRLTYAHKPVLSNKSEQNKLQNGNMEDVVSKNVKVSADDVFSAIWKVGKKYKYERGTKGQTYSQMKSTGHGDCWGFSDLISHELKRYKVNHKIVQYATSGSPNGTHRSVLYQNSKGKYVDYPYSKHGWSHSLYPTSKSKSAKVYYQYKSGGRIDQAKVSGSTTATETTTVTTTTGYDKDNPFQCYIQLTYSLEPKWKAKKYNIYLDFTQKANSNYSLSGLTGFWINNSTRKSTSKNIIKFLKSYHGDKRFYLHTVQLVTPKIKTKTENDKTEWYTYDKSTHDEASCKMDLYQITFDNQDLPNPSNLQSCGKSINELLGNVIDDTGYLVDMEYKTHRCDDIINFRVDTSSSAVFEAKEGDDNNILEWGNIGYKPISDLFNRSISVFKGNDELYHYVDTREMDSIFQYHEQTTLQTFNDKTGEKEAYFNAINNKDYNPEQSYSYTITVPNYPNLRLGEVVSVVANAKKLNDLKTIESIKISYNISDIPTIRTELGLGELSLELQAKQIMKKLRQSTKEKSTEFSSSAIPYNDETIYEWDY